MLQQLYFCWLNKPHITWTKGHHENVYEFQHCKWFKTGILNNKISSHLIRACLDYMGSIFNSYVLFSYLRNQTYSYVLFSYLRNQTWLTWWGKAIEYDMCNMITICIVCVYTRHCFWLSLLLTEHYSCRTSLDPGPHQQHFSYTCTDVDHGLLSFKCSVSEKSAHVFEIMNDQRNFEKVKTECLTLTLIILVSGELCGLSSLLEELIFVTWNLHAVLAISVTI